LEKVGIFGGTFDPIHFGHLITAQSILEKRELEKIIFVPAYIAPHKVKYDYSNPLHRFNMTKLAIDAYPNFDISDFEINHDDISYSYNTLVEFSKTYDEMELIIGFDNLITFDAWYKPDEILEIVELVVMKRTYDKEIKKTHKYYAEAQFVDTPTIEISATEIRERVSKNLPIEYFVPHSVEEYIKEHKLYKTV